MEEPPGDETLRHAVHNVANQPLGNVDLVSKKKKKSSCLVILIQLQYGVVAIFAEYHGVGRLYR